MYDGIPTADATAIMNAYEIINFAAAQVALDMIADHPERDEITRDLAAYGPAITERN